MGPIEQLILEHQHILRGIKYLKGTATHVDDGNTPEYEIHELLRFFKGYADDGHHAKEEAVLFEFLYKKNPDLKLDTSPLQVLSNDHIQGRLFVTQLGLIDAKYSQNVMEYGFLLERHIDIEDELFPVLTEDNLSATEIQTMGQQFLVEDNKRDLNAFLKILDSVEMSLF